MDTVQPVQRYNIILYIRVQVPVQYKLYLSCEDVKKLRVLLNYVFQVKMYVSGPYRYL